MVNSLRTHGDSIATLRRPRCELKTSEEVEKLFLVGDSIANALRLAENARKLKKTKNAQFAVRRSQSRPKCERDISLL